MESQTERDCVKRLEWCKMGAKCQMLLYTLLGNISSNSAAVPFLFVFSQLPRLKSWDRGHEKKIAEIEIEIETEEEEAVWVLANVNKFILLVRPLRCDSLTSGNLWGDASHNPAGKEIWIIRNYPWRTPLARCGPHSHCVCKCVHAVIYY